MKVLLSIKPKYADLIFNGTKKFEFRKAIFKDSSIKKVLVYASSPTKKVIVEFEIDSIINEELMLLWEQTKDFAGIEKDFFYEYFTNRQKGYAIKIKKAKRYKTPLSLKKDFDLSPPQSFAYLKS